MLDSEYGNGASFTFVVDLFPMGENQNLVKRHLNPRRKAYPKIVFKRPPIVKNGRK